MCDYLEHHLSTFLKDKKVLEVLEIKFELGINMKLGAGTGLVGMVAALLGTS